MSEDTALLVELRVLVERVTNLSDRMNSSVNLLGGDIGDLKSQAAQRWEIIVRLDEQLKNLYEGLACDITLPQIKTQMVGLLDREKLRDRNERDRRKVLWAVITGLTIAVGTSLIMSWTGRK
jgi:hypothetical protein